MAEYRFVTYEEIDDGTIVRIILNRPETRNAQNRGLLVELGEAFLAAEADDRVRVVILGGAGPMFSSGHDLGSRSPRRAAIPDPVKHPSRPDQRRDPGGRREADAAGVALLLRRTPSAGGTSARSPSPRCTAPSTRPA